MAAALLERPLGGVGFAFAALPAEGAVAAAGIGGTAVAELEQDAAAPAALLDRLAIGLALGAVVARPAKAPFGTGGDGAMRRQRRAGERQQGQQQTGSHRVSTRQNRQGRNSSSRMRWRKL